MLQASSFYEKRLGAHSFLSRRGGIPHTFSASDAALRDIEFNNKKRTLENETVAKGIHQQDVGDKKSDCEYKLLVTTSRTMRHSSRYNLRKEPGINIENHRNCEKVGHAAAYEMLPGDKHDVRRVTNTINYSTPEELHEVIKSHFCNTNEMADQDRLQEIHNSSNECVEDRQLRQLLEIKNWRSNLMQHVSFPC